MQPLDATTEWMWRTGGMALDAINVVASTREREVVIVAESPDDTAEFRCGECGYGIMVSGKPPACPMCRSFSWETSDVGSASTTRAGR